METADPDDRGPGEFEARALRDCRSRHDLPLEQETAVAGADQISREGRDRSCRSGIHAPPHPGWETKQGIRPDLFDRHREGDRRHSRPIGLNPALAMRPFPIHSSAGYRTPGCWDIAGFTLFSRSLPGIGNRRSWRVARRGDIVSLKFVPILGPTFHAFFSEIDDSGGTGPYDPPYPWVADLSNLVRFKRILPIFGLVREVVGPVSRGSSSPEWSCAVRPLAGRPVPRGEVLAAG